MNALNTSGSENKQFYLLGICLFFSFLFTNCAPDTQADLLYHTPNPNTGTGEVDKIGNNIISGNDAGRSSGTSTEIPFDAFTNGSAVVTGSVGYQSDFDDYYLFEPRFDGKIKVSLTNLNNNIYLRIYKNGTQNTHIITNCTGNPHPCKNDSDKSFPGLSENIKNTERNNVDDDKFKVESRSTYIIKVDPWARAYSSYTLVIEYTTDVQQNNTGNCSDEDEEEARSAHGLICDDITNEVKKRNCNAFDLAPLDEPDGRINSGDIVVVARIGAGLITFQELEEKNLIEKVITTIKIFRTFNFSNKETEEEEDGAVPITTRLAYINVGLICVPETVVLTEGEREERD